MRYKRCTLIPPEKHNIFFKFPSPFLAEWEKHFRLIIKAKKDVMKNLGLFPL